MKRFNCFSNPQIGQISQSMPRSLRSNRQDVFYEKGVLKNLAKFTGKHLCQSLLFNKVSGLKSATLFKRRLWVFL